MAADWTDGDCELTDDERECLSPGAGGAMRPTSWGSKRGSEDEGGGFITDGGWEGTHEELSSI